MIECEQVPGQLTADDIIPLIAALTPQERARLLRLIAEPRTGDASIYQAIPPASQEFSAGGEPLAWESDDWENVP